jgi:hypothetical protein
MPASREWTWEKSVALVLFYAIVGSLVFWGFGWSALKDFATAGAEGIALGLLTYSAIWLLLFALACLTLLLALPLMRRRAQTVSAVSHKPRKP